MTITNFGSGEVEIAHSEGRSVRLEREAANRLVMAGRMHTVAEFVEKIASLVPDPVLTDEIRRAFERAGSSTERWNLKEKFARLTTLAKGHEAGDPAQVLEKVVIS